MNKWLKANSQQHQLLSSSKSLIFSYINTIIKALSGLFGKKFQLKKISIIFAQILNLWN